MSYAIFAPIILGIDNKIIAQHKQMQVPIYNLYKIYGLMNCLIKWKGFIEKDILP